ncbi:MAG: GAF domain-containing sensor histidine kinase [Anaerolineae bacterium]|nr:GAF domain-containing sensor histidine kinase [Anaerolineae bacterium]
MMAAQRREAVKMVSIVEEPLETQFSSADDIDLVREALRRSAQDLERRYREFQRLSAITANINAGLLLDDVLERMYVDLREIIPYDRIGVSFLEDEGRTLRSRWVKTSLPNARIQGDYAAPLVGSSLEAIVATGKPRIINDLSKYLEKKPDSISTRLLVEEGIRSSLTCPLIVNGMTVGFMFFSSCAPNTYADAHVALFEQIAGQLAVIVEKGRLASELAAQKMEIEEQNRELRRLNDLKNTFLGFAAHDLRNPIGGIKVATELLLGEMGEITPEEMERMLHNIQRQSNFVLNLLNDLLDVAHIDSGNFTVNSVHMDMTHFLDEAVERFAEPAAAKSIRLRLRCISSGEVVADPLRLRQVIDNLLSNAIKYSPPKTTVVLRCTRNPDGWRVEVQDEGPGIRFQDRARLFEGFARLSARPTGDEKSTGLGLAITRRIVEAHGGQIGVESAPGEGSRFWFTLPNRG